MNLLIYIMFYPVFYFNILPDVSYIDLLKLWNNRLELVPLLQHMVLTILKMLLQVQKLTCKIDYKYLSYLFI